MATRGRKILMGCGGGCLAVLVLGIGACVSFSIWVNQPGNLLEPTRLLGRDTAGYLELTLRDEDPGAVEFLGSLLDLQQRIQASRPQRAPVWLNRLIRQNQQRNNQEAIDQLLPTVVAWTLRPADDAASDLHLFTVSVAALGNRARFMDLVMRFTLGLKLSVKYQDERIYTIEDDDVEGAMFIRDSSFFITNSVDNARRAVDLLRAERWNASQDDPTELDFRFSEVPEGQPLRGAIGNTRGELWRIWKTIASVGDAEEPHVFWGSIEAVTLTGDFVGERGFGGVVVLEGPSAEWAAESADQVLELVRTTYGRGHLPARFAAEARGSRVLLTVEFEDLLAFVEEL